MASEGTSPRKRRRRWPRRVVLAVLGLFLVFHIAGGWYFAGVIDERALDAASRRASLDPDYDLIVTDASADTVTLEPNPEWPTEAESPGVWGLRWEGGYGQLGTVVSVGESSPAVTRQLTVISGAPPAKGDPAEIDPRAYPNIESTGLSYDDVTIPGPLGNYPAWFVDAPGSTWVIVVHGNSMSRLDNVRFLKPLHDAGYPTLTVTYRNDQGAPPDPSGKLRYGETEWHDLEAEVRYAIDNGSEGIFMLGDSMGGGIILSFLEHSATAGAIHAVVLDAPMVDFSATVDDNASREPLVGPIEVPASLTWSAKRFASWRFGVDWDQLNYLADADALEAQFLVFHGEKDETIPIATSEAFARERSDLVTLVRCPGMDHIECWNRDPSAFEQRMVSFFDQQPATVSG